MCKDQHVVHNPNGGWNFKGEKNQRATVYTNNKKDAVKIAWKISQNQSSDFKIFTSFTL